MLQIIVNNQQVDLLEDTEVSITIEHPMLSTDHIPVPYSTDIDLPLSPRNRMIFGFVDRPARTAAFESLPARIFFVCPPLIREPLSETPRTMRSLHA